MAEEGEKPEQVTERTKVRPGMKREFEFALKYQSQIAESSGRTRACRARILALNNPPSGARARNNSRARGAGPASSDDSMTSDVVDDDVGRDDENARSDLPTTVRELLDTGFLDGVTVKYIYRPKGIELEGMIKDGGILCCCQICQGVAKLTAAEFESHAGNRHRRQRDRRQAENIYLRNGFSLHDVMIACQEAPSDDTVQDSVRMIKNCSSLEEFKALRQTGDSDQESVEQHGLWHRVSVEMADSEAAAIESPDVHRSSRQAVVAKSSVRVRNDSSSKIKSQGKITRKDQYQHKIVFEGVLPEGTEVAYFDKQEKVRTGHIRGGQIKCHCCYSVVSPSVFEYHAGHGERRKPFHHIYTSNGVSLHELAVSLLKRGEHHKSVNDDLCTICGKGGDLLCCNICPRSFHRACINLPSLPAGSWRCTYCTIKVENEKFEHNANAIAAGRVSGVDPIEQIINCDIRILNIHDVVDGGCVLCRSRCFAKSGFGPNTIMMCDQCDREYHVRCLKDHKMADLQETPEDDWFCSESCNTIHTMLQKAVNSAAEKLPDHLLDVIKKKRGGNVEVSWKLLSAKVKDVETELLLSRAAALFQKSFGPMKDTSTGADLISCMVYGKKEGDQDFSGMYCAVLTIDSSPVSAGVIRILGQKLAELPLAGTRKKFQGQGYFKALIACIEMYLNFLNVKRIVLPAANGSESIWVNKFGFTRMTEDEMGECVRDYHVMTFQSAPWYWKPVPARSFYPPPHGTVRFSLFSG